MTLDARLWPEKVKPDEPFAPLSAFVGVSHQSNRVHTLAPGEVYFPGDPSLGSL